MGFRGVFILLSVSMITMYSCVLGRDTAKSGISEITFGSGGGVTGRVVMYRLRLNGTIAREKITAGKTESRCSWAQCRA